MTDQPTNAWDELDQAMQPVIQQAQDDLEQGGIWHAQGTACPSGRPTPHRQDARCVWGKTKAQADPHAFELPTVASLQAQLAQVTRERDSLTRRCATRFQDTQALQNVVTELEANLGDARTLLDTLAASNQRLTSERDDARAAGQSYRRMYHAIGDRDLRRIGAQLTQLETHHADLIVATAELIDAIRDSNIQGPHRGRIDNLAAKASRVLLGGAFDETRVTLTDKGAEYLRATEPSEGDVSSGHARSVARVTRKVVPVGNSDSSKNGPQGTDIGMPEYNIPLIMVHPEGEGNSPIAPVVKSIDDRGAEAPAPRVDRYMMATRAFHSLAGDISRDPADIAIISREDEDDYIGEWVTGVGYISVLFPKDTTRELTAEEIEHFNGKVVDAGNGMWTIRIRRAGGIVEPCRDPVTGLHRDPCGCIRIGDEP